MAQFTGIISNECLLAVKYIADMTRLLLLSGIYVMPEYSSYEIILIVENSIVQL